MDNATNLPEGYKFDDKNKLRDEKGRIVSAAVAESIIKGSIIPNFDFNAMVKAKQKAAAKTVDMVAELNKISTDFGNLKPGMTCRLVIPQGEKRKFIMQIVTKLSSVTSLGGAWAGRKFKTAADDAGQFLYVLREADGEAHERKKIPGRKLGSKNAATSLSQALERSRQHFNGNGEGKTEDGNGEGSEEQKGADAIVQGEAVEIGAGDIAPVPSEIIEDARIVKH